MGGRLNRASAEGLTPIEAIRQWIGAPEDPAAGGIAADAQARELPSWWVLRTLNPARPARGATKGRPVPQSRSV